MANTESSATLTEKIYNEIYDDITHRRLAMGERLTLKGLSGKYGVSLTPVREALSRLAENGLIRYYSNRGVEVIDYTEEQIRDIFRFVGELDAMAVLFCQSSPNYNVMTMELLDVIENGNRLLEQEKVEEWKEYSQNFHKVFYKYAQSECLEEASNRLRPRIEMLSLLYYEKLTNVDNINEEHVRICERIRERDFAAAADMMRTHLQRDSFYAITAYNEYKEKKA